MSSNEDLGDDLPKEVGFIVDPEVQSILTSSPPNVVAKSSIDAMSMLREQPQVLIKNKHKSDNSQCWKTKKGNLFTTSLTRDSHILHAFRSTKNNTSIWVNTIKVADEGLLKAPIPLASLSDLPVTFVTNSSDTAVASVTSLVDTKHRDILSKYSNDVSILDWLVHNNLEQNISDNKWWSANLFDHIGGRWFHAEQVLTVIKRAEDDLFESPIFTHHRPAHVRNLEVQCNDAVKVQIGNTQTPLFTLVEVGGGFFKESTCIPIGAVIYQELYLIITFSDGFVADEDIEVEITYEADEAANPSQYTNENPPPRYELKRKAYPKDDPTTILISGGTIQCKK